MNQHTPHHGAGASPLPPVSAQIPEKPAKRWHMRLEDGYFATHHGSIKGTTLKVYLTLKKMRGRNASTWPRHSVIAADAGVSVSTVKRALKELREKGLVTWEHRTQETKRGKVEQISNRYFLAQIEPPPPSKKSETPGSKRATEQKTKREFIPNAETAPAPLSPSAAVASSSKDESTSSLDGELEALGISNATTRRRAADHPVEAVAALAQLRKKIRKGGIRDGRANYFMGTLNALVSGGGAPPPPQKQTSQFVAPECSDAPAVEYAPSEADIAMEKEACKQSTSPREFVEPLVDILARTAPKDSDSSTMPAFRATPPPPPHEFVDEDQLKRDAACEAVYEALVDEVKAEVRRAAIKAACGASNHSRLKLERCKLVWQFYRAAVAAQLETTQ